MTASTLGRLRRQPGYPLFWATATITRLADDMFSVGVVLLVLERTDSPGLAGATVAAVTLPSIVTGPLLGAWLDRSGRRRSVMMLDQVLAASTLVGIVVLAGNAPNWTLPLVALVAGSTWPLSFGGFTSLIPVIVPDELLAQANALEATSFNFAVIGGPALAGTISARRRSGHVAARGGRADARGNRPDRAHPRHGLPDRAASRPLARRDRARGAAARRRHAATPRRHGRRRAEPRRHRPADRGVPVLRPERPRHRSKRGGLSVGGVRLRIGRGRDDADAAPHPLAAAAGGAGRDLRCGLPDAALAAGRNACRPRFS